MKGGLMQQILPLASLGQDDSKSSHFGCAQGDSIGNAADPSTTGYALRSG